MYSRLALCLFFGCSSFLWAGDNTKKKIKESEEKTTEENKADLNPLYYSFPGKSAHVTRESEMEQGSISDSLSPGRYP